MTALNITIKKSTKEDKKALKRFYKQCNYPLSYMGYDHIYTIYSHNEVIGSAVVSYLTQNNKQGLLHALIISTQYRNNGYAKTLINFIANQHNNLMCFADKELAYFYKSLSFKESNTTDIPPLFIAKYKSYKQKNNNLLIFTKNNKLSLLTKKALNA